MTKPISQMNVYERVHAVMSELGNVKKDGNVAFGKTNYNYVSEAAFITALRPLMIRYRLIVHPYQTKIDTSKTSLTRITTTYAIVAVDFSGDDYAGRTMTIETAGEGADAGDKGIYKAMTGAFKYALRQSFMVATGDDAEATDANGNATNGTPTPMERVRASLTKNNIKLGKPIDVNEQSAAFAKLPRPDFMGGALSYWLKEFGVDISNPDYDQSKYAFAIQAYLKALAKAKDWIEVEQANTDLGYAFNRFE